MAESKIRLRNVRVNNLKDVNLDIPHGQWVAICGLSGSGKSSLAFDTLYAEGQRRYIECLSPGTRQFITQLDKPDAELIDGIPPAIAVQAVRGVPDRKSTVGNATEIVEHLRLLYARIGKIVCPICDSSVAREDVESVANWIGNFLPDSRYIIAFSPPDANDRELAEVLAMGRRNGFRRAVFNETLMGLDVPASKLRFADLETSDPNQSKIWMVVDRLVSGSVESRSDGTENGSLNSDGSRIRESLETAFQFGEGHCTIFVLGDSGSAPYSIDGKAFSIHEFSTKLICQTCGRIFPSPEPRLFSFNKSIAACEQCDGVGFEDDELESRCQACSGDRLNQDALSFRIHGRSIADLCRLTVLDLATFFRNAEWTESQLAIGRLLFRQIESRLDYLNRVGLGYLSLERPARTMSFGESQRVALTSCLSSTLVNMLYVLDEPSVGLHTHDVANLVDAVRNLNERGNTVVVVDHESKMIESAQRIIEVGPAAGAAGGEIVFDGTIDELKATPESVTGDFLADRRGVSSGAGRRRSARGKIRLVGASGHNLKDIDVDFPLGCLCVVSGVSGAGKSSLVRQTLFGALSQRFDNPDAPALPYKELFGESKIDEVVLVDHSPIGRTARSNPVTYVKAFDDIRKAFAETADAKSQNATAGMFSFNVAGGRCDKCKGEGQLTIDMQFLSDVHIKCDQCHGTRFRDETLAVRYRGRNIAEVLNLTVREAFTFFRGQPRVQEKLKALIDVGLEYVRLGQPATKLSSGEAQRLKLAVYLNASKKKRALFILEEPTTGLHMADVTRLLDCFEALLAVGHSFIIVEHNLEVMKYADWIIDLGPGPADLGGDVVVCGTPETVADCTASITGHYLAEALEKCKLDDE